MSFSRVSPLLAAPARRRGRGRMVVAWLVLAAAAVAGLVLAWTGGDVAVARLYYAAEGTERWPLGRLPWVRGLYVGGPWLAIGWAIGGLALALISVGFKGGWQRWGRRGLFFPLLMVLGPGLLVNGVGKDHWGRPRPKQIAEFGGDANYRVAGWPDFSAKDRKSFPSGHASVGFYWLAGYFFWRERRSALARGSLVLGVLGGLLIGWVRIVQGGHFLSDVLWAGAVVYASGEFLSWCWLREGRNGGSAQGDSATKPASV